MNLYLYIPPTSNHPPRQTKAIIYQILKKYSAQNTYHEDYLKFAVLLYRRYRARGHQPSTLRRYFLAAHNKLFSKAIPEKPLILTSPGEKRQSFLHCQYNAADPPGRALISLQAKHCSAFQQELNLLPPKICYSRPKNIGDIATQTTLHQDPAKPASHFFGEFQKGLDP